MYVDPNTGGMLFQILAGIFVVASGAVLVFSSKIKMLWARLRRRKLESADQMDDSDKTS